MAKVTIGSNVLFGPGVQLYAATHRRGAMVRHALESGWPITIGDDCWTKLLAQANYVRLLKRPKKLTSPSGGFAILLAQ